MDAGFEQVLQLGLCHAGVRVQSVLRVERPPRSSPAASPEGAPTTGSRGVRSRCRLADGLTVRNGPGPSDRPMSDYRLLNWNRFRAPGRPGFLRSTARGSRVMSPAARSLVRCCPSASTSARAMREPERACLARLPAAIHMRPHVERAERVGGGEALLNVLHQRRPREVVTQRAAVDVPLAGAGGQVHPGDARLAAAHGLPAELGGGGHALTFDGVTENGLGCWAACGCSGTGVDLELAAQLLLGERGLGQHAEHRLLDDPVRMLRHADRAPW